MIKKITKKDYFKEENGSIVVDFPELTAKEIYDTYGPTFSDGVKMIYSLWFEKEDFWDTQKSRPGRKTINTVCVEKGKNWHDCKAYAENHGGQMLNYAELLWLMYQYDTHTGKRILTSEYTWLDTPVIGGVGYSGYWCGLGPSLYALHPGNEWSSCGLLFSCTVNNKKTKYKISSLEQAVQACEDAGYIVYKKI